MTAPTHVDDVFDASDIDITALTLWLRSQGAAKWSPTHVEAALSKLLRALNGDAYQAVAYLEHLAKRNAFLWGFLSRGLSDELVALDVVKTVGRRPVVDWPDMPGRLAHFPTAMTFDELLDNALFAPTLYERLQTYNLAQQLSLGHRAVYCALHDQMMTFQAFIIHLHRPARLDEFTDDDGDIPQPRAGGDRQTKACYATHSRSNVHPAMPEEVEAWRDRMRRGRAS